MSHYNTIFKYVPRLLAVLIAAALAFCLAPAAFADETEDETAAEITEDAVAETAAPKVTSGSCGANLSWSFSAGTLTISGSGAMTNFRENTMAPWYGIRNEILRISLPEGLTSIGTFSFYQCDNLKVVSIPSSVIDIERYAFALCERMEMVSFGKGVKNIEENAFSDCYSLKSVQLPNSLTSIGRNAFYRCESLTTVTVPSSVTKMGISVFAHCKNLVSATVKAAMAELPEYTFYGCKKLSSVSLSDELNSISTHSFRGCDNLNTVFYNGEGVSPEELQEVIGGNTLVNSGTSSGTVTGEAVHNNEDGTAIVDSTDVTESENAVISSTTQMIINPETGSAEITKPEVTIAIDGENGWNEVSDVLDKIVTDYEDKNDINSEAQESIGVTIYIKSESTVNLDFVKSLAGKNVNVTFVSEDGSTWKISGADIDPEKPAESYDLRYNLVPGDAALCEELGVLSCYVLRFASPAEINAKIMIRIDPKLVYQNATLLKSGKTPEKVQTAVIDSEGYASFYLASVTEKSEYYIAVNMPGTEAEAIIPENMSENYGGIEYVEPIKYEITGRSSSWGMNLGQVMGILGAVMAGAIVLIGGGMFIWNRQKLKNGYVPDFEDEDE